MNHTEKKLSNQSRRLKTITTRKVPPVSAYCRRSARAVESSADVHPSTRAAQSSASHPSPHPTQSSASNLSVLLPYTQPKVLCSPNFWNVGRLRNPKPSSVGYPCSPKPSSAQPRIFHVPRKHMNHLKIENPTRAKNEQWLQVEHNRSFGAWIRDKDFTAPKEKGETSTQKRKRGPTEMKEITHARSEGQKLVIEYNELGQAIGQNATKLKSFIGTTVRFHVPITYSDWPTVPKEIKDKVSELIEAGFVVDPRSKKTIIQNAGVCFRQFKYRLTTTYVLPFLDDVEKLKFLSNEYSFTDQQHWTVFVASLLKEDFKKASSSDEIDRFIVWKQARMDRKGQISDEETKEVVNLIPLKRRLMLSVKKDILTRTLGGKDRPGILHGVGKYVTKKKYFHTATQQKKTNEKEDEKATSKEHDRMAIH
uniref:Uncharacterized protein n=1 Tax=Cucumis melo TaxID=3656 RepID=A0A9I9EDG5_CUCME